MQNTSDGIQKFSLKIASFVLNNMTSFKDQKYRSIAQYLTIYQLNYTILIIN